MEFLTKVFLVLIISFLFMLSLAGLVGMMKKNVCDDYHLDFSLADFTCYEETNEGVIKYRVEDVMFFDFKLNSIPITPAGAFS